MAVSRLIRSEKHFGHNDFMQKLPGRAPLDPSTGEFGNAQPLCSKIESTFGGDPSNIWGPHRHKSWLKDDAA
jgi:hypothetical protein